MQIDLEKQTIDLLNQAAAVLNGSNYDEVIVEAVSGAIQAASCSKPSAVDAEHLIDRFRRCRGLLSGVSMKDVLAARHDGLA